MEGRSSVMYTIYRNGLDDGLGKVRQRMGTYKMNEKKMKIEKYIEGKD